MLYHIVLFDGIRIRFCWNEEYGIVELTGWSACCWFWLLLFGTLLFRFPMFANFIIHKFFSLSLPELDVVKIIDGIKECHFSSMHRRFVFVNSCIFYILWYQLEQIGWFDHNNLVIVLEMI